MSQHYIGLLGVTWAQFPELWEITPDGAMIQSSSSRIPPDGYFVPGKYVKGVSGMTCVCPAWAILDLLELPEIKTMISENSVEILRRVESDRLIPDTQA